jgi:putative tryptophan/tyrosine transport system substrate-binding protein
MRRRDLVLGLAAAATVYPVSAQAEQRQRIPTIGILWHAGNAEEESVYLGAFREGLRDHGYVEGRNIALVNTFAAEQYERFNANAAKLVALGVDVLVAVSPAAAAAAKRATSTIPIVFIVNPDPVGSGIVASLARPGGNITGTSTLILDLTAKRLASFKEAVRGLARVAFLVNAGDPLLAAQYIEEAQQAAGKLGIALRPVEVHSPGDLGGAFSALASGAVDGVATQPDPMFTNERKRIAELALRHRLPSLVHNREMVEAGGLISYGPSFPDLFRRAAGYVAEILRGAKPADLPVQQPTRFELVINLKTAHALELTLPSSLLARADATIE